MLHNVALLGASGATGRHVVEVAGRMDVQVVAVVRDRTRLAEGGRVTVVEAELSDVDALAAAFDGVEAVISTLGVAKRTPDEQPSRHMPEIVAAMDRAGVERYIGISGAGLTLDDERKPLPGRFMSWLVRRGAPVVHGDKVREYHALRDSDLAWTLVRAPRLVDGTSTGRIEVGTDRPPTFMLTRGDMAEFLLRQVDDDRHVRQAPMISTGR